MLLCTVKQNTENANIDVNINQIIFLFIFIFDFLDIASDILLISWGVGGEYLVATCILYLS